MKYQCKICANSSGNETFIVREMMYGTRENFTYFRCSLCGCLQITAPPKDMTKYYPGESYYSFRHNTVTKGNWKTLKNTVKYCLLTMLLHRIGTFLLESVPYIKTFVAFGNALTGIKKNSAILDIGCGSGLLLQEMNIWGFKNLTGIDPFIEHDFLYSSGVKIFKQDVFNHVGMYDLVMLNHSFEHMDNPQFTLKQIHKMLNSTGMLLIRIPVSDSFAFRKYGTNWFQIDAPRHFFLHTTRSMIFLAKNEGFALKHVFYDSNENQFLQSEKYCRDVSLFENLDFSSTFTKTAKKHARYLNKIMDGDQACFVFENQK